MIVGEALSTVLPVPVLDVTPVPPLATLNVPVVPAIIGKDKQLDILPDEGVPNTGVINVGEVESTVLPVPVELVTPVPPLATDNVPVVPPTIGKPVAFVNTPELGVPKAGVIKVADVTLTISPVPELAIDIKLLPPSTPNTVEAVDDVNTGATANVAIPEAVIVEQIKPPISTRALAPSSSLNM